MTKLSQKKNYETALFYYGISIGRRIRVIIDNIITPTKNTILVIIIVHFFDNLSFIFDF